MTWRDVFLRWFGPGVLGGLTFGDWARVLRDNRFDVPPHRLPRALFITAQSVQNSIARRIEDWRYGGAARDTPVEPPVFVLGHWRSGTTHLHNLLALDQRFAFPNTYDALFPHAMISMERVQSRFIQSFLSPRRPMDNVEWSMRSPQEDEFALCVLTRLSPYMGWFFPKRRAHYDRYLTFRDVDEREVNAWQSALRTYCRRLTWKYKRPLVLKSPQHTGRVRLLLEIFPKAKFVHIRRDPFAVFSSTRKMLTVSFGLHCVQHPPTQLELDEWIITQYRAMHDAFFEEKELIPSRQYHEMSFEDLESDPIGQMQKAYEALALPDFSDFRPELERYINSIQGYQKNTFPELPASLRRQIADAWCPCFERWGYSSGAMLQVEP